MRPPKTVALPPGTNPNNLEINQRLLEFARAKGASLYIVGGFLRDCLQSGAVKKEPKDIDYAVASASAFALARDIATEFNGHFVALDQSNDTARVVLSTSETLDFAGCVGGTIESDVKRRDFTVNALVWDPSKPDVIFDWFGGVQDIESKTIRAISEKAFTEDPLRVLRAYRFAATLQSTIEPETREWIRRHAELLTSVAAERINAELFLTLAEPCSEIVLCMAEDSILEIIFPELRETRVVTANAFHHLALFEHSIDTVPQLEARMQSLPQWVHDHSSVPLSFGVSRLAATKLACLLHDVGKPQTWIINEDGKHTFIGHDRLGAEICEGTAERMKWSKPLQKFIIDLVKWHLRPGSLFHHGPPTDKAVRRFYRAVGNDTPELLMLAFADFGATRGPGLMGENRVTLENGLLKLLHGFPEFESETAKRVKYLDGNTLMKLLSIPAGPIVGEILSALDEAQEFKEVLNATEAELFVKNYYQQKYSK